MKAKHFTYEKYMCCMCCRMLFSQAVNEAGCLAQLSCTRK